MDYLNKFTGGGSKTEGHDVNAQSAGHSTGHSTGQQQAASSSGGGGFMSGLSNKINGAAGGGPESEKNEDYLDKGEFTLYLIPLSICTRQQAS